MTDTPTSDAPPIIAAIHAALDTARTCATIKLPKATAKVALHLATLGHRALSYGADPEAFRSVYVAEWLRLKGINLFPSLAAAIINLNHEVAQCQPSYYPAEVPTLVSALKARVKAHVGCDRMPICFGVGFAVWTDGAVFALPDVRRIDTFSRHQSTVASEELRATLAPQLTPLRDWVVGLLLAPTPATLYVGSDWSDRGGRVLAVQGKVLACYSLANLAILRGCGATAFQLVEASAAPRPKGKPAPKGDLLVGFRGREPVGFAMPIAIATGWDMVFARWQRAGAVPL